jgi:hypothetical protein
MPRWLIASAEKFRRAYLYVDQDDVNSTPGGGGHAGAFPIAGDSMPTFCVGWIEWAGLRIGNLCNDSPKTYARCD